MEKRDLSASGELRGRLANFLRVLGEGFTEKGTYEQGAEVERS